MVEWITDDFAYLANGTGGKTCIADDEWEITDCVLKIIDNIEEWVVDPDEPIPMTNDRKLDGILSTLSMIVLAPYAFFYMVISKMIDSTSAGFNGFLAFLERVFAK